MVTSRILFLFALLLLLVSLSQCERNRDRGGYREEDDNEDGEDDNGNGEDDNEIKPRYHHKKNNKNGRGRPDKPWKGRPDKPGRGRPDKPWKGRPDKPGKDWKDKRDKYNKYANPEARLMKKFTSRHHTSKLTPPERSINVTVSFRIQYLSNVDFNQRKCQFILWRIMSYEDGRVSWEPSKYDGISSISLRKENLWIPDIAFLDIVGPQIAPQFPVNAVVTANGTVSVVESFDVGTFMSTNSSKSNVECSFRYVSWTRNALQLQLVKEDNSEKSMMMEFVQNPRWTMGSVKNEISTESFSCCQEKYQSGMVRFNLTSNEM